MKKILILLFLSLGISNQAYADKVFNILESGIYEILILGVIALVFLFNYIPPFAKRKKTIEREKIAKLNQDKIDARREEEERIQREEEEENEEERIITPSVSY